MEKSEKEVAPVKGAAYDSQPDKLVNFMLADGTIRGTVVNGTTMVNTMRASHRLGILETLVLGHGLLAVGLIATGLKGRDRTGIQVECSGPIKGMVVEADAGGLVRGYLKNVPIAIDRPLESFDLRPFFGAGFLTVTRHMEGARHPYKSRVMMVHGTLAKDLAHYYLTSEQIPTAFALSIKFDRRGEVIGAGGLFLQAMPDADQAVIADLESMVAAMPSLGDELASGKDVVEIVTRSFEELKPRILSRRKIEFGCYCNREKVKVMLTMLGADELKDMAAKGPFPVIVRCHYCNTAYNFSQEQLQEMVKVHFCDN